MDLSAVNKHSARTLAFGAVSWSCLAGFELERGIDQLIRHKWQYDWISSFLLGSAFLAYGIFWSVQLLRRTSIDQRPIH
jgi:hypothetical protein